MLRGFDVSHWQSVTPWRVFASQYGIAFGFVKATQGETFVDSQFDENWKALKDAGLVRGAYHFAVPTADPVKSAKKFVDTVKQYDLDSDDILILDLERGYGKTQEQVNQWTKVWVAEVKRLVPKNAVIVYTGHSYMENRTGIGFPIIFAAWWYPRWPYIYQNRRVWPSKFNPTLPSPNNWGGPPDFWQFSSTWPAEGSEDHDANVFDGTMSQLRTLAGPETSGDSKPTTKPIGKYRLYRVKSGDTLSEIAVAYRVSVSSIVKINKNLIKDPDKIQIGWVLKIPKSGPIKRRRRVYHKIRSGENLTVIARHYGTSINRIMELNKSIKDPDRIYAGNTIRVR